MINGSDKQRIQGLLKAYCTKYPSQNKAALSLTGISGATVSNLLNNKWETISEEMWRNLSAQLDNKPKDWVHVETANYKEIYYILNDAQAAAGVTWIVGDAGCGKTTTATNYRELNREVFYVLCDEDMRKNDFIRETARVIGIKSDECSVRRTLEMITERIIQSEAPLLIFDEADKLNDNVFHYFINLYNRLEGYCGIVFLSTSYIERRMANGLRYNKKGYNEIHSRIGRKFFELDGTTANDVFAICRANGLVDDKAAKEVVADSIKYSFDLRRVKKAVHRVKRMATNE